MKSPFTGKEMNINKEWRTINFRKNEFNILFHSYVCEDTGEQFEDDLFSQLNYNQLVNQYRAKYNIPFPEQIIDIRKKYGLSAKKMSEILGFGTNIYRQYEKGEIPNQSNAKLIQLAENPHEFKKLLEYCQGVDIKLLNKINSTIENLIEERKKKRFEIQLEKYLLGKSLPSKLNGFKKPNMNRLSEMIVYFTEKLEPYKTKLNKLLFYADFIAYKNSGFSISGLAYRAIPIGPVPNNFNSIFEYLANNDVINICSDHFQDGGMGEQFKPNNKKRFRKEHFTNAELEVLDNVANRFKNTLTNEIIEISHKEKAWTDNIDKKGLIDYYYAFELVNNS